MNKKLVVVAAIIVIIGIIGFSCTTEVPTGHTGVVTTFGRVENFTLDAGMHFKLPWQNVVKMDNRIQKGTENLSCFSSDIQEVNLIYTVNYQISKANAMTIYSTIGESYYSTIIVPAIAESVKTCTAKYTAEQLISNRDELANSIQNDLKSRLQDYNIMIVEAAIENMDFTDAFTAAVEAKQVAQQNKLKAETEAQQKVIEAEAEANVKKIDADARAYETKVKAQAEAEANELLSASLTDKILNKMYYEKWNGILPSVMTDGGNALISIPAMNDDAE